MKISIILNAVVYNRGSEALIRGITFACKKEILDCEITLISSEIDFDTKFRLNTVDKYVNRFAHKSKYSFGGLLTLISRKFNIYNTRIGKLKYKNMIKATKDSDIIIIIGADNYDQSYNMFDNLHETNLTLKKYSKKPMILYDCSLEDKHFNKNVIDDIRCFDAITVREALSYENFLKHLPNKQIEYYPDPAFMMEPEEVTLPFLNENAKYIGLNLSSLVANGKYGLNEKDILISYIKLINYILEETDRNIILIPHVMKNEDLSILKKIYLVFENNTRVEIIENEDYNAAQLKYIISKLDLFIGARTHATIAAYSSFVPTLVIGYSIKSKGIAIDLFGTDENYVLGVDKLSNPENLISKFKFIYRNKSDIKCTLMNCIPKYIVDSKKIINLIKKYS